MRFSIEFVEHHLAHVASAYFISPWEKAAGISIDGSGDFVSCMMTSCEGSEITVKRRFFVPHSLGTLYTTICEFIGYGKYGDEGKVMGLSCYGDDNYSKEISQLYALLPDGEYRLNLKYFNHQRPDAKQCYSKALIDLLGPPRDSDSEIDQHYMDIGL